MLKKLLKILESEAKSIFKSNPSVLDIILFGSTLKGKEKPRDLDILLIFKDKKDSDLAYGLKKKLAKKTKLPVEVVAKSYESIFKPNFVAREAVLAEGYSLLYGRGMAEGLGFTSKVLFNYSLKGKNKSERMRFYYALYGRTTKGMLKTLGAIKYSDTMILCPVENKEKMANFFRTWEMEFKETSLLIPQRLVSIY